jgi:predicted acetyltransferase
MTIQIISPNMDLLPSYLAALERNWTSNADSDAEGASRLVARIKRDPEAFLASLSNLQGKGSPITLEDGSSVPRIPFVRHWIWDGEYAGDINLRWQPGTSELPSYVLGHVGYAVVPWKRGADYASIAIRLLMPVARGLNLDWLDISMDAANIASRRTAEKAGATLIKTFDAGPEYGGVDACLYRISLR